MSYWICYKNRTVRSSEMSGERLWSDHYPKMYPDKFEIAEHVPAHTEVYAFSTRDIPAHDVWRLKEEFVVTEQGMFEPFYFACAWTKEKAEELVNSLPELHANEKGWDKE